MIRPSNARRAATRSGGHEHHAVGGKQFDVYRRRGPRAGRQAPEDRTARGAGEMRCRGRSGALCCDQRGAGCAVPSPWPVLRRPHRRARRCQQDRRSSGLGCHVPVSRSPSTPGPSCRRPAASKARRVEAPGSGARPSRTRGQQAEPVAQARHDRGPREEPAAPSARSRRAGR